MIRIGMWNSNGLDKFKVHQIKQIITTFQLNLFSSVETHNKSPRLTLPGWKSITNDHVTVYHRNNLTKTGGNVRAIKGKIQTLTTNSIKINTMYAPAPRKGTSTSQGTQ
jgi:hypothetical protein